MEIKTPKWYLVVGGPVIGLIRRIHFSFYSEYVLSDFAGSKELEAKVPERLGTEVQPEFFTYFNTAIINTSNALFHLLLDKKLLVSLTQSFRNSKLILRDTFRVWSCYLLSFCFQ